MASLAQKFDQLAGIDPDSKVLYLDRACFAFLTLTAISAPHSIAATQTAWLLGLACLIVRLFFLPRVKFRLGILDLAVLGLFLWTVVTAFFSYDQPTSLGKLRSAAVFVIFYFALYNLRHLRSVVFIALVLIGSCMINVLWVPVERLIGRGVEIRQVAETGPLGMASLIEGDTLLEANGKKVGLPKDVVAEVERSGSAELKFYRPDYYTSVRIEGLRPGATAIEKLGIGAWKRSKNWRSSGFYGHYATYAEVLQLIGSLLFGIIVAGIAAWRFRLRTKALSSDADPTIGRLALLTLSFLLIAFALLLTVTRAPQLGLMLSATVIVMLGIGRRGLLFAAILFLPIAIGGLIFLQQSRNTGFFDQKDESTRYRFVMFRDGMRLSTESPRNFIFGVGMDSIKTHWREWGMFEGGKLPLGHFHSTPVQLMVERGVPALLLWLLMMGAFVRAIWKGLTRSTRDDWLRRGILLGCLGATVGFVASGIVHFNFGDQEVVMTFYLLMAMAVSAGRPERETRETTVFSQQDQGERLT